MAVGPILMTSIVTVVFCAIFAMVIDVVTDALSMSTVIGLVFVSGFCGSLVAQIILRRKN